MDFTRSCRIFYYISAFVAAVFVLDIRCQDNFYFSVKPISADIAEGGKVILRCDVSNRRHIRFHWTLDDVQIDSTSRRFQSGSNLHIARVNREEDFGAFRCIATNVTTGYSLKSTEAILNILWIAPEAEVLLHKPKSPDLIKEQDDVTLKCQVEGHPDPSYLWFRNKIRLFNNDKTRIFDSGRRLKVTGVQASDNGVYSCTAENPAGQVDSMYNFLINVPGMNAAHLDEQRFTKMQLVKLGGNARLDCAYSGAIVTEWNFNDKPLVNTSRIKVFNNGSVYITGIRNKDAGSYKCLGLSENGPMQTFSSDLIVANLSRIKPEDFEPQLIPGQPMVVPTNGKFEVRCFIPKGIPQPTHHWKDPKGNIVQTTGRIRVEGTKLRIVNAQPNDSGNYSCVATNLAGEMSTAVWIEVSVAPVIVIGPKPSFVLEGQSASMSCKIQGSRYPVTRITWIKNGIHLEPHPRFIVNEALGTLKINNVYLSDEGNYACFVNTSGHTPVTSSNAKLSVTTKLKFKPSPVNTKLELGSHSKIHCMAEGEIKPTVKWMRIGYVDFPPHVTDKKGILNFKEVMSSDAGFYTCTAKNPTQGMINVTIEVAVVVKPKFKIKPHNTTAYEGYEVLLDCVAIGDPTPTIQWDKNSQVNAFDRERFKVLNNGSLYVKQIFREDRGRYGCTAGNSGGFEREEIFLEVAGSDQYIRDSQKRNEEGFSMMKTVVIAVCSAVAYLGLVIGLTVYCSLRVLRSRNKRKSRYTNEMVENGTATREQQELVDKDKEGIKTDSDARSMLSSNFSYPNRNGGHGVDDMQFPRHNLQTLGMLGKGEFGDVFLARAHGICEAESDTLVVVKSLLSKDEMHQFDFRKQIDMFNKIDSDFVVKLLGTCRETEPQFMILEYCEWGDLKQFLRAMRKDNGRNVKVPPLTLGQKISMCSQIAMGMENLASHRFIHKDLAARNVLLSPNLDLKISNLGLCRDVYAGEYYTLHNNLVPLRWLAPESINDDEYTTKSDVWTFGIFMWEVFTLGDTPYRRKTDDEIVKLAKQGELMSELPPNCPEEVSAIMLRCWAQSPKQRQSFSELSILIGELMVDSDV
ncbi:inactive tyrosine-protein kinase 7-like [Tubulanus polymorphus]|uniref:inactive tyrosine-protein kinase 7-like n=1 Tax=Tubulanus polymorphus TaxID=672921 RepID=UPI003DA459D1